MKITLIHKDFHNHDGRPGQVGGSLPKGSASSSDESLEEGFPKEGIGRSGYGKYRYKISYDKLVKIRKVPQRGDEPTETLNVGNELYKIAHDYINHTRLNTKNALTMSTARNIINSFDDDVLMEGYNLSRELHAFVDNYNSAFFS